MKLLHLPALGRHVAIGGCRKARAPHPRMMAEPAPSVTLPPSVDLGPWMPPVVDQGQIGSCTANMGCELVEFLERLGDRDTLLSRLYLYYYVRQLEGTPPGSDSGAEIPDILRVLEDRGVPTEASWPYEPAEVRFDVTPPAALDEEAAKHKSVLSFGLPTIASVKACLAAGFPVGFGMSVYPQLLSDYAASTGLVELPGPTDQSEGGHAVVRFGYDDNMVVGDCRGAWRVRNSWGPKWGLNGCFWLPYAYDERELAYDDVTVRRLVAA